MCWIEALEFLPGIRYREAPVDGVLSNVALPLPGSDFALAAFFLRNAACQTLTSHHTEFDLSHVHPAAMPRSVMECQLLYQLLGRGGLEGFIQRAWTMRTSYRQG